MSASKQLNLCWANTNHTNKVRKCISTCVQQNPPMPAMTQNVIQHVLNKPFPCQRRQNASQQISHMPSRTQNISQLVLTKSYPMPAKTQIVSQLVLNKQLPCHHGQKMHLNMGWTKPSHASDDTKSISTCVEKTYHMPTKTICISTCVDQTHHMLEKTQKGSQLV